LISQFRLAILPCTQHTRSAGTDATGCEARPQRLSAKLDLDPMAPRQLWRTGSAIRARSAGRPSALRQVLVFRPGLFGWTGTVQSTAAITRGGRVHETGKDACAATAGTVAARKMAL